MPIPPAPEDRIHTLSDAKAGRGDGHIVYWMVAARRTSENFGLQHAIHLAQEANKPLIVLEAIGLRHRWASSRFHHFVIEGMRDNAAAFENTPITYYPYVEANVDAEKGMLEMLAQKASVIVTDLFPCYFIPKIQRLLAERVSCPVIAIDSLGILPLRVSPRVFTTAASFRRHMQKTIVPHLHQFPRERPLARLELPEARLPRGFRAKYPPLDFDTTDELVASLPIDQEVHRVSLRGGTDAAHKLLRIFLDKKLPVYGENRNHPDTDPSSGLSPYLHFGHLSAHTIVRQIFKKCNWTPDLAAPKSNGSRNGWWGISESPEAFLDQIVTWREIGHVFAYQRPDHAEYTSLPDWALKTLDEHRDDPRPYLYTREEFETATTHDDIWNAAQRQLVRDGVMHNYLRMLWAKKILHWTKSPEEALEIIVDLNNKYALDGRDPNSYSGIFWTLGRFDRAWGPERPIFGKIRYMTSDSTRRKLKLKNYLEEFGASKQASLL